MWASLAISCWLLGSSSDTSSSSHRHPSTFPILLSCLALGFLFMTMLLPVGSHPPVFCICVLLILIPPSHLPLPFPLSLSMVWSLLFLSISPVLPPSRPAFYSAAPLTSAGIIPIMQSLCPDGQRDEFGFLQYKNSTWVDPVSNYLWWHVYLEWALSFFVF